MARWANLTVEERFWAKVEKSEGCWNWTAGLIEKGYGRFRVEAKRYLSHRYSFELAHGPIPDGMQVDHVCHNRACVRPTHLRLASNKQNMENLAGLRSDNTSGVRGVSWNKQCNRWIAHVAHNQQKIYLGLFDSIAEAEQAVIAKRNELFTHNNLDRVA